jgi:hypothetical protein
LRKVSAYFKHGLTIYGLLILVIYRESEYAAWTLVNGHALNHVTISAHRLKTDLRDIKKLNQFLEESGFRLNSEGGVLKGICIFVYYFASIKISICNYKLMSC